MYAPLIHGIYRWEFVTSLDFDWQFLSGKKQFRWPLVGWSVYHQWSLGDKLSPVVLFCRSLLSVVCTHRNVRLISLHLGAADHNVHCSAIALNVRTEIDCQGLYTFNQVFGNAAVGLASINLSIRT